MDPPIKIGRFRKNRLGSPNKKTVTFCRRLGMIRTQWWQHLGPGPGQLPDAREGCRGLTREVRLELEDCEERVGLREEGRDAARHGFRRPKMSDVLTDYNVAIVIRWGIKQTPNAMKLGRRSTYTITRPLANFQPNPRTFSGHL